MATGSGKRLAPLPDHSHQRKQPVAGTAAADTAQGLAEELAAQRAAARKRARRTKAGLAAKSKAEIVEFVASAT